MDATRFDYLTRSLTDTASRRMLLGGFAASLGLAALCFPMSMEARKKRKNTNKKKQPAFNQFGCLNVGQKCRGNSANCCSGICQGKKPKKGQKDKSVCVAHDTGDCPPGLTAEICGGQENVFCTTGTGFPGGTCLTTTGNAGYCGADSDCRQCTRDADCRAELGPQAACVVCATCAEGTRCAGPDDTV